MLDNATARANVARFIDPIAGRLLAAGISPDTVTWAGAIGTLLVGFSFLGTGHTLVGGIIITVFSLSDLLDGTMARMKGSSSTWGAFLDSTLDRLVDGGLLICITFYFVRFGAPVWAIPATLIALITGQLTSYIRAKAEALGADCTVGLAERSERSIITIAGIILAGTHPLVLPTAMGILAVLSTITVVQRIQHVNRQLS